MQRFNDQVAIVTGAAHGIGAATARRLGQEGASVLCADLDLAAAEVTASAIQAAGGKAIAVAVDVTQRNQVESMVAAAVAYLASTDSGFITGYQLVIDGGQLTF